MRCGREGGEGGGGRRTKKNELPLPSDALVLACAPLLLRPQPTQESAYGGIADRRPNPAKKRGGSPTATRGRPEKQWRAPIALFSLCPSPFMQTHPRQLVAVLWPGGSGGGRGGGAATRTARVDVHGGGAGHLEKSVFLILRLADVQSAFFVSLIPGERARAGPHRVPAAPPKSHRATRPRCLECCPPTRPNCRRPRKVKPKPAHAFFLILSRPTSTIIFSCPRLTLRLLPHIPTARAAARTATLASLDPRLSDPAFDAAAFLLASLPPSASAADAEAAAEATSADLAAVDAALAAALARQGPALEAGLAWVGGLLEEASATAGGVGAARRALAAVRAPVAGAACLAAAGKRRAAAGAAAAELYRLRTGVRAALAAVDGEAAPLATATTTPTALDCGAAALAAAAAARAALTPLAEGGLAAAASVLSRVAAGEAAAVASARAALASAASAFSGATLSAALLAYQAAACPVDLRGDVAAAFGAAPAAAMLSVVRGAALTRAHQSSGGGEDEGGGRLVAAARAATTVAAAAALLPPPAWAGTARDAAACAWDALASHSAARAWLDGDGGCAGPPPSRGGVDAHTLAAARAGLASAAGPAWAGVAAAAAALLRCPGASSPASFPAVADWGAALAAAGDAFNSGPGGGQGQGVRAATAVAAVAAFEAAHARDLASLQASLNAEAWRRVGEGEAPPAVEWAASAAPPPPPPESWAAAVAGGNPFKAAAPEPATTTTTRGHGDGRSSDWTLSAAAAARAAASYAAAAARHPAFLDGPARTAALALFDAVLVHTAAAFSGAPLGSLLSAGGAPWGDLTDPAAAAAAAAAGLGSSARPSPHLRSALARAVTSSLPGLRTVHSLGRAPPRPPPGAGGVDAGGPCPPGASAAFSHAPGAPTARSHPGNLHALGERVAALDGLAALAAALQGAAAAAGNAGGLPPAFTAALACAPDLRRLALATAARLNLPLGSLRASIATSRYAHADPPAAASPWVAAVSASAEALAARLDPAPPGVPRDACAAVWAAGRAALAAAVLDGLAAAGVGVGVGGGGASAGTPAPPPPGGPGGPPTGAPPPPGPAAAPVACTPMGRSAMSADLQALAASLGRAGFAGGDGAAPATPGAALLLRPVDAFIKAWYLGFGPDLRAWARGAAGVDMGGGFGGGPPLPPPLPRPAAACLLHAAGVAGGVERRAVAGAVAALDAELEGAAAAAEMMMGGAG